MTQGEIQWAEAARDAALEAVAASAGDRWLADAAAWLEGFLLAHSEYVPDRDNQLGPQPPTDRRAWGVVTQRAIRARWVEPTGEYVPRTRGHATPGRKYRSLIYRGG